MDRQKIGLIFGLALLGATLLTWFVWAKTQAPRREERVGIIAASRDLPVGTLLKKTDLKIVAVSKRDVPRGALFTAQEAMNRVLIYPVSTNEPFTHGKTSAPTSIEGIPSTIEPGYRAVSVQINDTSGVTGLIQPGSRVDVLFTRPGTMAEAITTTILQNVRVLSIGKITQVGQTVDPKTQPTRPMVTLVVTPQEAQKLELAKNQGKISLALRNPLDGGSVSSTTPVTTEVLDPVASARLARARRGRTTNIAGNVNLDDPRVWQELTGEKKLLDKEKEEEARRKKEPEKPRVVVDVFRGDKHVQEMFR